VRSRSYFMRVEFRKGKQREFFKEVLLRSNCPSLRELKNRGIDISYSTIKNYFSEKRLLPLSLFETLCNFVELKKEKFDFKIVEENWGQIIGGKKSRK